MPIGFIHNGSFSVSSESYKSLAIIATNVPNSAPIPSLYVFPRAAFTFTPPGIYLSSSAIPTHKPKLSIKAKYYSKDQSNSH